MYSLVFLGYFAVAMDEYDAVVKKNVRGARESQVVGRRDGGKRKEGRREEKDRVMRVDRSSRDRVRKKSS